MRATLALLAAAALLCPQALAQKAAKTPKPQAAKDSPCPLSLIFPADLLLTQGQPQKATLQVYNPSHLTLTNVVINYTIPNGQPIPPSITTPTYPGVVVTGAAAMSKGPAPVITNNGKLVTYTIASIAPGQKLKLSVMFLANEGFGRNTDVTGRGYYTGGNGACVAIMNEAATARMRIQGRITPETTFTSAGGVLYQQYWPVYGLCPKIIQTIPNTDVATCAAACDAAGDKGCTAFTFATRDSNTCKTYQARGNQGRMRLTYRVNTTSADTRGTIIYVKGAKPRALFPATCP